MKLFKIKHLLAILIAVLLSTGNMFSQDKLPALTQDDYEKWERLGLTQVSPDGNWIVYQKSKIEGNDTLYIKSTITDSVYKSAFSTGSVFTKDSKWLAYRIGFSKKKMDDMREKKQPIVYKMGLFNLITGKEEIIKDASSFAFSENSEFITLRKNKPTGSKAKGNNIVLRKLNTGTDYPLGNLTSYSFNKKGDYLAYISETEGNTGNAVVLFDLAKYQVNILESDTVDFSQLIWEKEGNALAFMKSFKCDDYEEDNNIIYTYRNIYKTLEKNVYNPAEDKSFSEGKYINNSYRLSWAEDLSSVFFGVKDWTKKEKKEKKKNEAEKEKEDEDADKKADADSEKTDDKKDEKKNENKKPASKKNDKLPGVDVWHWNDDRIQPLQQKRYNSDKNFSYMCGWNIDTKKFIQIGKKGMKDARISGDQRYAVAIDRTPYEPAFKLSYADYYLVDLATGEREKIFEKFTGYFVPSPDGEYFMYFKDKNWWTFDIRNKKHIALTKDTGIDFWNIRDDHPAEVRPPFGTGGWLKDDKAVLLYDEYDVWSFKPDGSGSQKLTKGRDDEIIFRVQRLDYKEEYIDPKKPIYLRASGDKTKKSGYYRMKYGSDPVQLIFDDKAIGSLQKAEKADKYIYTSQTYVESPNVFYVGADFNNAKKYSDTNPQQKDFAWGKTELINYVNADGVKLQGSLHYPANYEEGKKYPMVVYIYEILSRNIHRYITPSVKSSYNVTNYVQEGFFIFQPDIIYKLDDPGVSAVDCVVPAVKEVIKSGKIDEDKIGLMGHSWGAYQTAFIITMTDIFSAAVAGAPLTDMISMYTEVYWNSGGPNASIFETSQGRFTKPYFEEMDKYIENSPMFNAAKINTPLLVTFGDKDGAVDWHQGIEMYTTMRRMKKNMIMLVYADENHGLRKEENMLDYTKKVNQFFRHHLLGEEPAKWISDGVSYLDKKKKEEKKSKK
ncbi:prolyl oligopeptidase family serine peptidase [Bacteroidota bacterium]